MKLDKIKFAKVVAFISNGFCVDDVQTLDDMIDVDVKPISTGFIEAEKVDELLRCMQERLKGGLIPAIKAYRALTNAGLKEAKEAVEKYCIIFPPEKI